MHKADPGVELRETRDALLDPGHADQNHADASTVEGGAQLFEAVHLEPISFVDHDESGRIYDLTLSSPVWFGTSGSRQGRPRGDRKESSRACPGSRASVLHRERESPPTRPKLLDRRGAGRSRAVGLAL